MTTARPRSLAMLVLQGAIVLQLGHQFEHVVQMVQMHIDGQPPAFAHGLIGRLDLEWVHFGMTMLIATVAIFVLVRWPRNPFSWLLMPLALWHLAEHTVMLTTYLRTGITGTPGIFAHGGLLNGPLARPDLHFLYNAAILVLLIGVWAWERYRPWMARVPIVREKTARLAGAIAALGMAAALSLLVLSGSRVQWVGAGQSLQAAINAAPAGAVLHLRPTLYSGPLIIHRRITLIGPATIVAGPDQPAVTIAANGVNFADISVQGGETGVLVTRSINVRLESLRVTGSAVRGINIVLGAVQLHRCQVSGLTSPFAWGIGVVNSMGKPPTTIEQCSVEGGQEGIVSHASMVFIRDNQVRATALRGITVTEMSQGDVDHNRVEQVLGTGLYCGDRSSCNVRSNTVIGTQPEAGSPVAWGAGYGAVVLFGANAYFDKNDFRQVAVAGVGVFLDSSISKQPVTMSMP